jgi:hypothetical protein
MWFFVHSCPTPPPLHAHIPRFWYSQSGNSCSFSRTPLTQLVSGLTLSAFSICISNWTTRLFFASCPTPTCLKDVQWISGGGKLGKITGYAPYFYGASNKSLHKPRANFKNILFQIIYSLNYYLQLLCL